jgi:exodeoxyribonuclease VII small subunit
LSSTNPAEPGFDETLAKLEQTIALLADGSAPLEELVAAHQRAADLLSHADESLEALKTRAERLARQLNE